MSRQYIPNTSVEAVIIDPVPMNGYVDIFLHAGQTNNNLNQGSVNAGTSNYGDVFAVGLKGINGAFASKLSNHAGQDVSLYKSLHQSLYNNAGKALSAYQDSFSNSDPIQFSLLLKPPKSFNLAQYDGIVFIDVFNANQLPYGNDLNYAMLYVVPPLASHYSLQADFLHAIEKTNITLVNAINLYNNKHAAPGNALGLAPIKDIRMCLFSGGYYRGNATIDQVALHNLRGLESAFSSGTTEINTVYCENSYDDHTLPGQNVFRALKGQLADSPS